MNSLISQINELKKQKNAILLVHNYQPPEIQDIADFLGDSLGLSLEASRTTADIIVFCGVSFMAETAKILSPKKTVLLPEKTAGCPMADTITAQEVRKLKTEHPKAKVLAYVNTTAEVKAECDYCCTSANAVTVVTKGLVHAEEIIFLPDKNLANYVSRKTGRQFILWDGSCPIHAHILPDHIRYQKQLHPHAEIIVHPECLPEVIDIAHQVLSTEGMSRYIRKSSQKEFIIGTEVGILYRLRKENPDKLFYPASAEAVCPDMKKITIPKVLHSLKLGKGEVILPESVRQRAEASIRRMLEFTS
jgi:quinolinate synthase